MHFPEDRFRHKQIINKVQLSKKEVEGNHADPKKRIRFSP